MRKLLALFLLIILSLAATSMVLADTEAISYGDDVTGTLSNDAYEQFYTFEGQEGDTILIQMMSEPTEIRLDSYLILRDADGNDLFSDDDGGGNLNSLIGPYTLQNDGTFTIVATRYQRENGSSVGDYTLSLEAVDPIRIDLDTPFNIALEAGQLVDFFTFTAPKTSIYRFDLRLISGDAAGDVTIRTEDGVHLNGLSIDPNFGESFTTLRLEEAQTLTLVVRNYGIYNDDGSQDYTPIDLQLTIRNPEAAPISVDLQTDATISGTLSGINQPVFYGFAAEAGQIIQIEDAGSQGDFELYILMPNGMTNYYGSTYYLQDGFILAPQILTQSGEYSLVIYRTNSNPDATDPQEIVDYALIVSLEGSPTIENGIPVEGIVNPEQSNYTDNAYVYYGRENETITVTLESLSDSYAPSFSIEHPATENQDPHGGGNFFVNFNSSVPGNISYEVTLPEDGAYIFRLYDGIYEQTTDEVEYRLTIES